MLGRHPSGHHLDTLSRRSQGPRRSISAFGFSLAPTHARTLAHANTRLLCSRQRTMSSSIALGNPPPDASFHGAQQAGKLPSRLSALISAVVVHFPSLPASGRPPASPSRRASRGARHHHPLCRHPPLCGRHSLMRRLNSFVLDLDPLGHPALLLSTTRLETSPA